MISAINGWMLVCDDGVSIPKEYTHINIRENSEQATFDMEYLQITLHYCTYILIKWRPLGLYKMDNAVLMVENNY